MYKLPGIKRISAFCVAVALIFGTIGITKPDNNVITKATPENSAYAEELEELSDRQKELEKKIADANDSIKGQQEKLNAVAEQMSVISQKIQTTEEYAKQIEDEMCLIDEEMRATQVNLTDKEEAITENVNGFMKRLRAMYINGTESYTSIIADSADFFDILMRTELIKRVAEHDNDTITQLLDEKKEIDEEKVKLEKQSDELKKKSKEYAEKQASLSDEYVKLLDLQTTYGDSISQLESDKGQYQAEIDAVISQYSDLTTQTEAKTTTKKKETKPSSTTSKKTTTNKDDKPVSTTSKKETTTTKKEETKPESTTSKTTTTTKAPAVTPPSSSGSAYETKINILMSTAKSMVGGSYVWGGTSPNATDCSGLTMQCYAKIGISLPHKASLQANYGTAVSYSNMKKGDLIFFGGSSYSSIYHVAIYIGDGKMIHAENTYTGIVMSYVSSFAKYNNITCIKRLI